jgi:hypothetical protein
LNAYGGAAAPNTLKHAQTQGRRPDQWIVDHLKDAAAKAIGASLTGQDIIERKKHEEREHPLMREVIKRQNVLRVEGAIVARPSPEILNISQIASASKVQWLCSAVGEKSRVGCRCPARKGRKLTPPRPLPSSDPLPRFQQFVTSAVFFLG